MTTIPESAGSIIVTGAARGQGAAEVLRILRSGLSAVAVDIIGEDDEEWRTLHGLADAEGGRLRIVSMNVANENAWDRLAGELAEDGTPVVGLVNNAGIALRKTVTTTDPDEWDRVISVNLRGAYLGIRALAPLMRAGGSIVNVSSVAGMTGSFTAAYTASKWGLRGLTRAAAMELAHRRIRVNTVCPGLVDTPMTKLAHAALDIAQTRAYYESVRERTLLGRGAEADEIAAAVIFLLSDEASFITGTDLVVDGGILAGGIMMDAGAKAGLLESAGPR